MKLKTLYIILFIIIVLTSCLSTNTVKDENQDQYNYSYLLDKMQITEADLINLNANDKGINAVPVNSPDKLDHLSEAFSSIYSSKAKNLNDNQKQIFNDYFPPETKESVYKIIAEILKARVESDEAEKLNSLREYLKSIDKKYNTKIYKDNNDATNDIMIISDDFKIYYDDYIEKKISSIITDEFKKVKKVFPMSNKQVNEIIQNIKNFYLIPDEGNKEYLILAGTIVYMIVNKQDRYGEKPYLVIWDSLSNAIKRMAGDKFHENWDKKVMIKVKKEGSQILKDLYSGKLKEKYLDKK